MTQRVIKFRAWHNEAKAMLQVGDNHGTTHPLDCALYARQGQDVVLMLWTGLLDKHGKEIYDGDLLKYGDSDDSLYRVFWNSGKARFQVERFWKSNKGFTAIDALEYSFAQACTVAGNIYSNPELTRHYQTYPK